MDERKRSYHQLIGWLCVLVFINVTIFTLVTSFAKSNFLTAIQTSSEFRHILDHKPYFFLYGFSSLCFIVYYFLYQIVATNIGFERRVKNELLTLMICSLVLYVLPTLVPDFYQRFFPAAVYFVVYDIFDELIILQTWTLINYCINIRESKKIQNLFLCAGGVAAFIAGRFIIGLVPQDLQLTFLLMVIVLSGMSYLIVRHVFLIHRGRILTALTAEKVGMKSLLESQKKYRIIKSIIYLTILIGIFNLFFKVLFDMQVNQRFPFHSGEPESAFTQTVESAVHPHENVPDPKTEFIGQYKAYIYMAQVMLQLMFLYFFAR